MAKRPDLKKAKDPSRPTRAKAAHEPLAPIAKARLIADLCNRYPQVESVKLNGPTEMHTFRRGIGRECLW
jgi:hypothetical protein